MLLEFSISNYKCFTDTVTFSMVPTAIRDLDYSILISDDNKVKALSSSVIYGPNASGKTNLIGAMETLKYIIKRGHIRNAENIGSPNYAKSSLELIPNYKSGENVPIEFRIKFYTEEILVDYSLNVVIGEFLQKNSNRFVDKEILFVNDKMIFERNKSTITFGKLNSIDNFLLKGFNINYSKDIVSSNPNNEELFLCNMFKNLYSTKLFNIVTNWLDSNLEVIYSCNSMESLPLISKNNSEDFFIDDLTNSALSEFGLFASKIAFKKNTDNDEIIPVSFIANEKDEQNGVGVGIDSNVVESFGTLRFMNIFPALVAAISEGKTLVIDEFDASIHPMALMSIINIFHNDEVNTKNAQLIFNTHNPIFLNNNLFRRDEIKFMEYDENEGKYEHYALSDFGTNGPSGVRNTENYMNNYFVSKYGAIKDIDFTPIFERAFEKGMKNEEDN